MTGAKAAKGDVIVFLDAHCECHKRWLEPMLARIAEDPTRVQTPVIENIDKDSFSMGLTKTKAISKGVFNWVGKTHASWLRLIIIGHDFYLGFCIHSS